jgi:hypothetical protein
MQICVGGEGLLQRGVDILQGVRGKLDIRLIDFLV